MKYMNRLVNYTTEYSNFSVLSLVYLGNLL